MLDKRLPLLGTDPADSNSTSPPQVEQPRGLKLLWELAVVAPLGGRADHPAKWVLLKQDDRARRFIVRYGPLFQDNKGDHLGKHATPTNILSM